MADNKKNNTLNEDKVERGRALTPGNGEKPEKEQTPIEKVILGELTKIVEGINFDDKFNSIKTAIESIKSEELLPTLEKINDKFNPILGALYGDSNIKDTTDPSSLLGKIGHLDTKPTMFAPIESMLKSIYDLLVTQTNNKSSYELEDEVIPAKLPESSTVLPESSTSITNCINGNAIDIIDKIGEISLDPINNFTESIKTFTESIKNLTKQFTSRTAHIIDILNPTTKEVNPTIKEVNTKALQYDININASGLDANTVEALINLSKISTDSTDYLENLNNVLSNLSNFEALNNLKLDNKNIQNFVDSINALSEIKLVEDSFNSYSVDNLKYFINALSNIDLSNINQFDEDSLESISMITDMISYFSKLKLENFDKNIKSLNAEEFAKLLNTLKDIPVYNKEDNTTMTAISDLFSAVSSISGFNESKFEDLSSNLRSMIRLTEKPSTFTFIKISDTGLIHILMHNIGEIAAGTKETFDNTKNIGKMINLICSISNYDFKSLKNLKQISYILGVITDKEEPYLYKAFNNIEKTADIISKWDRKNSPILLVSNQLKAINGLSSKIKLKNVFSLAIKSTIIWEAMYSLAKMFNYLKEIGELSKSAEEYITNINNVLVGIKSINIDNVSHLDKVISILVSSFNYLKLLGALSPENINVSKHIKILNDVIKQINTIGEVKNTKNIELFKDSIKHIFGINMLLATVVITAPLAYLGAVLMQNEITIFDKIVDKLNTIKEIKNLKNVELLKDSIKYISGVNMVLAVAGITAPLAYLGAILIQNEITIFAKIIGKLNKEIKPIKKEVYKNLKSLVVIIGAASGLLLFSAFVGAYVLSHSGSILGFSITLGVFIFSTIVAFNLATRGMKEAKLNAKEFGKLLLISGSIMILGGAIMTMHMPLVLGSLAFTVALGAFILLTIGAFNLATKGMKEAKLNAKEFGKLLLISGGIMILGGAILLMHMPLIMGSFAFTALLSFFILTTIGALNLATIGMNEAAKNARDFAILIGVCAVTMLLGGALITYNKELIWGAIGFSLLLAAFIFGTIFALNYATKGIDEAVKNARDFAILIGVCAIALLIGGTLIVNDPNLIWGAIEFTVLLGLFIGGTIFALKLATNNMKEASKSAREFAIIIGISAAAMLIGGLFMLIPGMPDAIKNFTISFVVFMGVTLLAYTLASKHIKDAKKTAIGFGIIVLLTSAALLIGGGVLLAYPGLDKKCLEFAGLSALFILIFGGAIWLLSKIDTKELKKGGLALAGIAVLIGGFGYAFTFVAEAMQIMSKVKEPWVQLGIMGTVFAAMIALVAGVTALITGTAGIGAGAIAAAEGVIGGVIVLIGLLGLAMSAIAKSMMDLEKVKNFESKEIVGAIGEYISLIPSFLPLSNPAIVLTMAAAKSSVNSISEIITDISTSVKAACDLKTSDGKQLTPSDFVLAANNVKTVVSVLGNAILEIYENDEKGIFSAGSIGDLLGMDTPFSRVSKSCSTLGQLITDISAGVKDFAEMKMPIYDNNGKIKGYRPMNDSDFKNAAKSIKAVVTILGHSLLNIYNDNKDIFSAGAIGDFFNVDTPFSRVSKSCATMGQLISDISAGVKDFAEMKIPIYDDKGNIKGYRPMVKTDFTNAATNINDVITTIAYSLIEIYNNNEKLFSAGAIGDLFGMDPKFSNIVNSCATIGQLVSNISTGIKDFAEFKIPIYDDKGNIIGYKPLIEGDLTNAKENIKKVVVCLAEAIGEVYNESKDEDSTLHGMFTDSSWWGTDAEDTPFSMIVKSMTGVGDLVNNGIDAITKIANTKIDFKGLENVKNGNDIKFGKISKITTILADSIMDVYRAKPEIFEDKSLWGNKPERTPFGMVMQSLNKLIPFIKTATNSVNSINNMKFNTDDLETKVKTVILAIPKAVKSIMVDANLNTYLLNADNHKKYNTMKTAYDKFKSIIDKAVSVYSSILDIDFKGNTVESLSTIVSDMIKLLPEQFSKLNPNLFKDASADASENTSVLDNISSTFKKYKSIIDEVNNTYKSIINTLETAGISGKDTSAITTLSNNLNLLINGLSNIKFDNLSFDSNSSNSFMQNISGYSTVIDRLVETYNKLPGDLSKYDAAKGALEGINLEISNIDNLEAFEEEQQFLEKYVVTLNKLDLDKVGALSNLMSTMNALATKLGSLDRFTNVLNTRISETLTKLANEIKISGDIINKADSLQKKRHEAIKASIKEIQSIMDKKLIVEVNHADIQSTGPDSYPSFSEPEINTANRDSVKNSEPSMFKKAADGVFGLFGGSEDNNANKNNTSNNTMNTPKRTFSNNIGGIDYDRLKEVIMTAIIQASDSAIDINRR